MPSRRLLTGLFVAVVAVVGLAPPAGAHGGAGGEDSQPSNFRTRVLSIGPAIDGLRVRAIDTGSRLELTNETGTDVVIEGYEGEPYLLVTADGVFENRRSPATYLNVDRFARAEVPPEADAAAAPEWRRIDGGSTARWHDHRSHWMSPEPPPMVAADTSREHVIFEAWEVPLRVGDEAVTVVGDLAWIPGPSAAPVLPIVVAAAGAGALASRRRRRAIPAALLLAVVLTATMIATFDRWWSTTEPSVIKAGSLTFLLLAATVLAAAFVMRRRVPRESAYLALGGAAGLGLARLGDLDWLTRSQLPSSLDPTLARGILLATLAASAASVALIAGRLPGRAQLAVAPAAEAETVQLTPSLRRHRALLIGAGAAVFVGAVWIAAPEDGERDPSPTAADGSRDVHGDLCDALAAAADGDMSAARSAFLDRAHGPLHEIAASTQAVDRAAAARLLEAKQRVEAAVGTSSTALQAALADLVVTVRTALAALDEPTPQPCPEEAP